MMASLYGTRNVALQRRGALDRTAQTNPVLTPYNPANQISTDLTGTLIRRNAQDQSQRNRFHLLEGQRAQLLARTNENAADRALDLTRINTQSQQFNQRLGLERDREDFDRFNANRNFGFNLSRERTDQANTNRLFDRRVTEDERDFDFGREKFDFDKEQAEAKAEADAIQAPKTAFANANAVYGGRDEKGRALARSFADLDAILAADAQPKVEEPGGFAGFFGAKPTTTPPDPAAVKRLEDFRREYGRYLGGGALARPGADVPTANAAINVPIVNRGGALARNASGEPLTMQATEGGESMQARIAKIRAQFPDATDEEIREYLSQQGG